MVIHLLHSHKSFISRDSAKKAINSIKILTTAEIHQASSPLLFHKTEDRKSEKHASRSPISLSTMTFSLALFFSVRSNFKKKKKQKENTRKKCFYAVMTPLSMEGFFLLFFMCGSLMKYYTIHKFLFSHFLCSVMTFSS